MDQIQAVKGNVVYADQLKDVANQLHSITKILSDIPMALPSLRRVFRGEVLYQDEKGNSQWIQVVKPSFVRVDYETNLPIKIKQQMPW